MTFLEHVVDNIRGLVLDHLDEADYPGSSSITSVTLDRAGGIVVAVSTGRAEPIRIAVRFSVLSS